MSNIYLFIMCTFFKGLTSYKFVLKSTPRVTTNNVTLHENHI